MAQQQAKKAAKPLRQQPPENPNGDSDVKDDPITDPNIDGSDTEDGDETQADEGQPPRPHALGMLSFVDGENETPADWSEVPNAPQDGLILAPGEPLRIEAEDMGDGASVRITKNVYRAFMPMGSKRWGFTLEYPIHHIMPKTMLVSVDSASKASEKE